MKKLPIKHDPEMKNKFVFEKEFWDEDCENWIEDKFWIEDSCIRYIYCRDYRNSHFCSFAQKDLKEND